MSSSRSVLVMGTVRASPFFVLAKVTVDAQPRGPSTRNPNVPYAVLLELFFVKRWPLTPLRFSLVNGSWKRGQLPHSVKRTLSGQIGVKQAGADRRRPAVGPQTKQRTAKLWTPPGTEGGLAVRTRNRYLQALPTLPVWCSGPITEASFRKECH